MSRLSPLLVALLVLTGCRDDDDNARKTADAATVTATATASAAPETPPRGVLSEEDFKALHALNQEQAPAPEGDMIDLAGGQAYLSLPEGEPPHPALVVIHEWWGLNRHIKHWADRLAAAGYATVAVDLYGGKTADNPDAAMQLMKAVEPKQAKETLLAGFAFLKKDARVKAEMRGSIGWCFGGKWSLELALAAPELDAAVVYYGHVETDPARLAALEAPLLAIFGNEDEGVTPKMVDRFEFGLEQAGHERYRILRYDAKHAFANPSSARYDQKNAATAWKEVQSFLAEHLKKPAQKPTQKK